MTKMNWARAKQHHRDHAPAPPRRAPQRRRGGSGSAAGFIWPATVTVAENGGIRVVVLRDRKEADAQGFDWVGRIS